KGFCETEVADCIVREKHGEFTKFGDRGTGIGMHERLAKIFAGVTVLRVEAFYLAILTNCRDIVPTIGEHNSEIEMKARIVGLQRQRFLELFGRAVVVPHIPEKNAKIQI